MKLQTTSDVEAEEILLGACVRQGDKVAEIAADLEATDFHSPRHQVLWQAWTMLYARTARSPDMLEWARECNGMPGGEAIHVADILALSANTIGFNRTHVNIIKQHKAARNLMMECAEARNRVSSGDDPYEVAEELNHFISTIGSTDSTVPEAMTIWEMSELSDSTAPWIIPGALKQDWRALVTGFEGSGKGVLLRSMAMTTAAGIHPFTHRPITPYRTLLCDLENPKEAILETGLVLANTIMQQSLRNQTELDDSMFKIWHRPQGINIRNRRDRADLIREIVAQEPKLVCIGPYYKMTRPKPGESWEDGALAALSILDELRIKYGFALVIEAHSPKGGDGKRGLDPIGSVYLKAWPELGIGLRPDEINTDILHVEHTRGSRLRHQWPNRIERCSQWVISGCWDSGRVEF